MPRDLQEIADFINATVEMPPGWEAVPALTSPSERSREAFRDFGYALIMLEHWERVDEGRFEL